MTALLARQVEANVRPRPSSTEYRPPIDRSDPILAITPNFDRTIDRRLRNHSTPKSNPQVRQTANPDYSRRGVKEVVSVD